LIKSALENLQYTFNVCFIEDYKNGIKNPRRDPILSMFVSKDFWAVTLASSIFFFSFFQCLFLVSVEEHSGSGWHGSWYTFNVCFFAVTKRKERNLKISHMR